MCNSNKFYEIARSFCKWIENTPKVEKTHYKELLCFLSELYNSALYIQDVESIDDIEVDVERITISFGKADCYWEIFNSYECEEPVCGSLSDDFADIYKELKIGVILYEKGHINDAVWNWKWSFENHWSYHAVDAMRVLNTLLCD